ncbi:MAG: SLBB domain-containing protein, partial [Phycisphaerales bacterium]|nr:SLBB domain-containing protein [Phycisphaerales bacterium]
MTVSAIQDEIAKRLQKYIPDPLVTVAMQQIQGNVIYVIGKVNRPGMFVMTGDTDVMQALALAGGTATFADLKDISVLRREGGSQQAIAFNYAEIEKGRGLEQNIVLQPGDVVVVP